MEINFENKDQKLYSSISEINKLKKNLIPNNFVTIENKANNININHKNEITNEMNEKNDENKITENKSEEEKNEEIINENNNINKSNDENNNKNENNSKNSRSFKKEEDEEENEQNEKYKKINQENEKKEEESINEEEKEPKFQDLIPLWYKCKNKEHGDKYITLDRKKVNLICKNCYISGALETNLELNQEFIDHYLKEQEEKNNKSYSTPNDNIIKETIEDNDSDNEQNLDENKLNKSIYIKKCLTFQCENFPYYFCEACQDFICYHCIMQRMNEKTDKSRHYYHDIESVNYESNSFKDDINLELNTITNKINLSLDYLIENEKIKNQKLIQKLKTENKNDLLNYIINISKRINSVFLENSKITYNKYIEKTFKGKDNIINDLQLSSNNTKKNIANMLEEMKEIKESMNDKNITNEDKCDLHQKYLELLKNGSILINKGNNILNQTKEELNDINEEKTKNKLEADDLLSNKLLLDNEKSLIQSLSNKTIKQGSYQLNRFVTYKHEGFKYFNFTSLELICQNDTILYGLYLCGKYLSSKKLNQIDYSTIPKEKRGYININIKIFEKDVKEPLIDENKKLYEIVDVSNPIIDIFFEKGIKMKKDIKYIILVENLEDEKYSDIWFGKVYKKLIENNKQIIRCINSGNLFTFYMPKEYNSDFNEFEQGIIEGISYRNL